MNSRIQSNTATAGAAITLLTLLSASVIKDVVIRPGYSIESVVATLLAIVSLLAAFLMLVGKNVGWYVACTSTAFAIAWAVIDAIRFPALAKNGEYQFTTLQWVAAFLLVLFRLLMKDGRKPNQTPDPTRSARGST